MADHAQQRELQRFARGFLATAHHHQQVAEEPVKVEFVEHAIGVFVALGHARRERRDVNRRLGLR